MALYTNKMDLGEAIAKCAVSDRPDGLFSTVVVDEQGALLGLVYSSVESIKEAVRTGKGIYQSRKRGLWIKGNTISSNPVYLKVKHLVQLKTCFVFT
jgi:phosphoribosyl-AMP cyclohydrolase